MNIQPLKKLALKLLVSSPLRTVLLAQPDKIPNEEFASKIDIIFQLAKLEEKELRA